jgi:hypothetical protein
VTIFTTTRLKRPNETLSPIISSNAYLIRNYYFKGIFASFIYKSAHIRGSLLSTHTNYNIYSIIPAYIRCRRFESIKCIATRRGRESRAVLYIRSRLLAFLVALLSLLYNFPINKYL